MKESEKEELIEQISGLFVYYGAEISPVVLKIYITALLDYPLPEIKKTVSFFIKNYSKMPKVSDFIDYIAGGISLDDRAEIAWSLVLKAIEKYSYDMSFTFKDKAIRKTLDVVGYNNIRECLESEIHWKKADFIKVYKTYAKLNPASYPAPDYIAGFIELSNSGSPEPAEENQDLYLGKSVYIVEDGVRVMRGALSDMLKLTGGQDVKYAKIA